MKLKTRQERALERRRENLKEWNRLLPQAKDEEDTVRIKSKINIAKTDIENLEGKLFNGV